MKRSSGLLVVAALILAIGVLLVRMGRHPAAVPARSDAGVESRPPVHATWAPILASPAAAVTSSDMSLSGRLVSRLDGSGVGKAEITFSGQGQAYPVTSAPDGSFRFQPTEPGTYQLATVSADGFLPFAPTWGDSPLVFTARAGYHIDGVVLHLEPTKDIAVEVAGPSGAPLPEATVSVAVPTTTNEGAVSLGAPARTDGHGRAHVVAPIGAVVSAECAGYSTGQAALSQEAWTRGKLSLQLAPDAQDGRAPSISGRVVDPRDAGLADIVITARRASSPFFEEVRWWSAHSAQDGRFTLDGLVAGTYTLSAVSPGLVPARLENVEAGSSGVVLRLSEEGGWISGQVVSEADSRPVPSFVVILSQAVGQLEERPVETRSYFDAQGSFTLGPLAAAGYRLRVAAHGHATSKALAVQVTVGATARADVRLSAGGTLEGKVLDAASRRGIAGAHVVLEGSALGEGLPLAMETSDVTAADGAFRLLGLPPGPRSLSASASGYDTRITSGIRVEDGRAADPVEIALTPIVPGAAPSLEITGIGAALAGQGDVLVVGQVIDGGGAAEAGIVPGDAILAIDATSVTTMDFNGAMQRIRGPAGTTVVLRVKSSRGEPGERDVVVTRRLVRAPAPPSR